MCLKHGLVQCLFPEQSEVSACQVVYLSLDVCEWHEILDSEGIPVLAVEPWFSTNIGSRQATLAAKKAWIQWSTAKRLENSSSLGKKWWKTNIKTLLKLFLNYYLLFVIWSFCVCGTFASMDLESWFWNKNLILLFPSSDDPLSWENLYLHSTAWRSGVTAIRANLLQRLREKYGFSLYI